MEPEQIVLLQESFDQLRPHAAAVATAFYTHLFAVDPHLRERFQTPLLVQGDKLMLLLTTVVDGLWSPDALTPVLMQLGQRHTLYGVQPEHYSIVGDVLLATLADAFGDAYTPAVAHAWTSALAYILTTMQHGAAGAGEISRTSVP